MDGGYIEQAVRPRSDKELLALDRSVITKERAHSLPHRVYRPQVFGPGKGTVRLETQWNELASVYYLIRITFKDDTGHQITRILSRDEMMGFLKKEL